MAYELRVGVDDILIYHDEIHVSTLKFAHDLDEVEKTDIVTCLVEAYELGKQDGLNAGKDVTPSKEVDAGAKAIEDANRLLRKRSKYATRQP